MIQLTESTMNVSFFEKLKKFFRIIFYLKTDLVSRIKILFSVPYYWFRTVIGFKGLITVKIKLIKNDKSAFCYLIPNLSSELLTLYGIFIDDVYDIDIRQEPNIIFDLGSHIGLSIIYFKLKYPKSKIYAFEPDPEVFKILKKNCSQFKNTLLFNTAISYRDGKQKFFVFPGRRMSSSLIERLPRQRYIKVKTTTLDSVIEEGAIDKIDLLKFNIEGYELRVFKNFQNLNIVMNLVGELHMDLMGGGKEDFLALINPHFEAEIERDYPKRVLLRGRKRTTSIK